MKLPEEAIRKSLSACRDMVRSKNDCFRDSDGSILFFQGEKNCLMRWISSLVLIYLFIFIDKTKLDGWEYIVHLWKAKVDNNACAHGFKCFSI